MRADLCLLYAADAQAPSKRYQPEQITHWLTYLAQQMKRQNQTLFYLEQMQPDWLSVNRMIWIYNCFAVRLPDILMGILVSLTINVFISFSISSFSLLPTLLLGGLLGGLLSEGSIPQRPTVSGGKARSTLGARLLLSLLVGALIGLGSGLPIGLSVLIFALSSVLLQFLLGKNSMLEARSPTSPPVKGATWKRLIRRKEIRNGLLVGLITALSAGLLHGLYDGLSAGLGYGLIYGLSAGLLSILLIGKSTAVQPTDLLVWSWRSLGTSLFSKSHAITTVRLMALIGLSAGLSIELSAGLGTYGLIAGLSYWLVLGLLQSVSGVTVEDQRRVVPNQGIHRSALNGLVLGLISTVIVGLVVGLIIGLASQGSQVDRLSAGLSAGLSTGLSAGLLYGGLAFLRHYILRFLLWRTGSVPWQYVTFLDYAAERILLRKVGGGYIFLHRLVLDYFAAREIAPVFNETTERRHVSIPAPVSPSNAPSEPIVPAVPPDLYAPTIALVPPTALSEPQHALPCGHELHIPSARFCSTCGAPIPFSFLP